MASTVSAANLKVKITEEVMLNGKDQGGTTELTIGSITNVVKRIVNIGTDEIGLLGFGTAYNTELSKIIFLISTSIISFAISKYFLPNSVFSYKSNPIPTY